MVSFGPSRRLVARVSAALVALAVMGQPAEAAAHDTFNYPPDRPTGMTTSPATSCRAEAPTIVRDGQITLYAPVYDPDTGVLGVEFNLWKTDAPDVILDRSDPSLST